MIKEMKPKINKNLIYIIILMCGVGILSFIGLKILKSSNAKTANSDQSQTANGPANSQNQDPSGQSRRGGGARGNFKPLEGTITSISEQTIVMKADDGSTKTINCSDSTRIMSQDNSQRTTLTLNDLKSGDLINVMSNDNTQATIDARMIFLGQFTPPQNGGSYRGGSQGDSNSSSPDNQSSNNPI